MRQHVVFKSHCPMSLHQSRPVFRRQIVPQALKRDENIDSKQSAKIGAVAFALSAALGVCQPAMAELNKYEAAAGDVSFAFCSLRCVE